MKVKIFIWALMLIWFISCSISDPSEDITIENYKINIVFDRETFEFDSLELNIELDPIAFPESLKVASIKDSTSQDFNDYYVEGGSESQLIQYSGGATINPGANVPANSTASTIEGIPDSSMFLWAHTDSMKVDLTIANNYDELIFDSFRIQLLRKDTIYFEPMPLMPDRVVIDTTFNFGTGLLPTVIWQDSLFLDGAVITEDMTLLLTAYNQRLSPTDNTVGLDANQNLYFDIEIGDCTFHSAYANFNEQSVEETDTYGRDDTGSGYGNVELRYIILRAARLAVDVRNNTNLEVDIDGGLDRFYDLRADIGETVLVDVDPFIVAPRIGFVPDIVGPVSLDSCKLYVDEGTQSATVTHTAEGRAAMADPDYPYVLLTLTDSISFYYEVESDTSSTSFVPFYEFDGYVESETIQISEKTGGFAEDIDWDDWNGVSLESMNLNIIANFTRDSLEMDKLDLEDFEMRGIKTDGSTSAWVWLESHYLTDFDRDTLLITERAGSPIPFTDIINFQPDTIEYRANATMTFDGKLLYTDALDLELLVSTPLEIRIDSSFTKTLDVHKMDKLDLGDGSEVLELYINSFINNPPDSSDRNAIIEFTINISDEVIQTVSSEEDSLLTGDVKEIFSLFITANPTGFENGYMLNNLTDNNFDEKGISFPDSIINMMMEKDTYLQEIIEITPDPLGPGSIYLDDTGSIEVQTKISGEFKISTGDGK